MHPFSSASPSLMGSLPIYALQSTGNPPLSTTREAPTCRKHVIELDKETDTAAGLHIQSNGTPVYSPATPKRRRVFEEYTVVYPFAALNNTPVTQCTKRIELLSTLFPPFNPTKNPSEDLIDCSFEEQKFRIQQLIQLGIPLEEKPLHDIYNWLRFNKKEICENKSISYPALFQGHVQYAPPTPENPNSCELSFRIEVHSKKRVLLLFFDRPEPSTYISQGNFKRVLKAFNLTKPRKLKAYLMSLSSLSPTSSTQAARNEEIFLNVLQGNDNIVKVHEIFYYDSTQIILMKYYPCDFFSIIAGLNYKHLTLSDEEKLNCSIDLLKAIVQIHAKGIIHRDIKPENILFDPKDFVLTDFGLSCLNIDSKALSHTAGSLDYLAPEAILGSREMYGTSLDIWAAGCVLWQLWKERPFPWYGIRKLDYYTKLNATHLMHTYHQQPLNPDDKIEILLRMMLDLDPLKRITALEALNYLQGLLKPTVNVLSNDLTPPDNPTSAPSIF
ncbi:protein kinase domain-containing protein [Candidatus Protochlamydia phocaeensis]|uniref:protein kinase domain-containing protein n=1 Tax=Candidatus Protochlamydia phocaeensis TaxID=1414722 RepID=UPI000838B9BB|nr:protein kinase [Candidatus Protochlamydia phocaeensis]